MTTTRTLKPRLLCAVLALAAASVTALATPDNGWATAITLESSSGGVYDYGITVDAQSQLLFSPNDTITLSGLSGVTGASTSGNLGAFFSGSFTPTSATFVDCCSVDLNNSGTGNNTPFTFGTLVVDSSVLTLGTVNYSAETSGGTLTGTVQG